MTQNQKEDLTTWLRKWERTKGSGFTHTQINAMLKKMVTDASPLAPLPLGGATAVGPQGTLH